MAEYKPGVCNIGPRGRLLRIVGGIVGLAISVTLWWVLRLLALPDWTVLLVFVPLLASFVSLFEGALSFCVVFGERGTFDLR